MTLELCTVHTSMHGPHTTQKRKKRRKTFDISCTFCTLYGLHLVEGTLFTVRSTKKGDQPHTPFFCVLCCRPCELSFGVLYGPHFNVYGPGQATQKQKTQTNLRPFEFISPLPFQRFKLSFNRFKRMFFAINVRFDRRRNLNTSFF